MYGEHEQVQVPTLHIHIQFSQNFKMAVRNYIKWVISKVYFMDKFYIQDPQTIETKIVIV